MENCYFFINCDLPEDERNISAICEECHEKNCKELGWFWKGKELGYGNFDIKCTLCNKTINEKKNDI